MLDFIKDIELPFKIPTPHKSIKVAVTGLSRSGKSVFLTSMINQLIANDKLPFLNEKLKRSFKARLLPPDSVYSRFDYYSKLNEFRKSDPAWPKSTKSVSRTTLELEFKSEYALLENQIIRLELIDYPGEWLLDLAMLGTSYEEWSKYMIELARESKRAKFSKDWLLAIDGDIDSFSEERLFDLYSEYIKNLYYHGFSFVQPGRFVEPGDMKNDPILTFCPLLDRSSKHYDTFKKRYDLYLKEVVNRLYLEHFREFDTQIVLVDLVRTLNGGQDVFDDMHLAIKNILKSFTYGSNSIFSKFFDLKIDHVLFAATKADYIPLNQRESYKRLLEEMIWDIKRELDIKHVDTEVDIFASVKSTKFVKAKLNGIDVDCIRGVVEGESELSTHFPGVLPTDYKDKNFWRDSKFNFVEFKPIPFPSRDTNSVEHIRMDRIIYSLLKGRV